MESIMTFFAFNCNFRNYKVHKKIVAHSVKMCDYKKYFL